MKASAGFTSPEVAAANRKLNDELDAQDNNRSFGNPDALQSERERQIRAEKAPQKLTVVRGKSTGFDPTTNPVRLTEDIPGLAELIQHCQRQWLRHKDRAENFSISPLTPMFNSPETAEDVALVLKEWAYAAEMLPPDMPELERAFHKTARMAASAYRSGFARLEMEAILASKAIGRQVLNGDEVKPTQILNFAFKAAPILAAGWQDGRPIPGEIEDAILALDVAYQTATDQVRQARIPQSA